MSQLEKVHLLTSFPYAPHLVNPLCLRGGLSGVSHAIHMEESDLKKVFRKPFVQVSQGRKWPSCTRRRKTLGMDDTQGNIMEMPGSYMESKHAHPYYKTK